MKYKKKLICHVYAEIFLYFVSKNSLEHLTEQRVIAWFQLKFSCLCLELPKAMEGRVPLTKLIVKMPQG